MACRLLYARYMADHAPLATSFALIVSLLAPLAGGCLEEGVGNDPASGDADKSLLTDVRPAFTWNAVSRAFDYACRADSDGNPATLRGVTKDAVKREYDAYKGADGDSSTYSITDWGKAAQPQVGVSRYTEETVRILRDMFESPTAILSDMGSIKVHVSRYDWGNTDEVDDLFADGRSELGTKLAELPDADIDALYAFWSVPSYRPFHLAFLAEVAFAVTESKGYLYLDTTNGQLIARPTDLQGTPLAVPGGDIRMGTGVTRAEKVAAMLGYYDALMGVADQVFTAALASLPLKTVTTMNMVLLLPELGPNLLIRIEGP